MHNLIGIVVGFLEGLYELPFRRQSPEGYGFWEIVN